MIMDINKPYIAIGDDPKNADFVEQDGRLFAWSESNLRYEEAWWLALDITETPLVINLRETRPAPPANAKRTLIEK